MTGGSVDASGSDDNATSRLTLAIVQQSDTGSANGRALSDAFRAFLFSAFSAAAAGVLPRAAGPAVARVIGRVIERELTAVLLADGRDGGVTNASAAEAILAAAPSSTLRMAACTAPFLVLLYSASVNKAVANARISGAPSTALMTALVKRANAAADAAAAHLSTLPRTDDGAVPADYAISIFFTFARSSPSPDTAAPFARAVASTANALRNGLAAARATLRVAVLCAKNGAHVALVPAVLAVSRACASTEAVSPAVDAAHDSLYEDARVFADGVCAWAKWGAVTVSSVTSADLELLRRDPSTSRSRDFADVAAFRDAFAVLSDVNRTQNLRRSIVEWALQTAASVVESGGDGAALEVVVVTLSILVARRPHPGDGVNIDVDDAEYAIAVLTQIVQRWRGGRALESGTSMTHIKEGLWSSLIIASLSRLCARVAPAAAPALLGIFASAVTPATDTDALVDALPFHQRVAITRGAASIRAGAAALKAGALPSPSTACALRAATSAVSPSHAAQLSRAWADILHTAKSTLKSTLSGGGALAAARVAGAAKSPSLTKAWKDGFADGIGEAVILAEGFAARAAAAAVERPPSSSPSSSAASQFDVGHDARAAAVCFWGPCARALGASENGLDEAWFLFPLQRGASTGALAAAFKRDLPQARVFGPDAGYAVGFAAADEGSATSGAVFCGAGAAASAAASFGAIDRVTGALCFPTGNGPKQDYVFVFPATPSKSAPSSSPLKKTENRTEIARASLDEIDSPSISAACALTRDTEYTVLIASSLSIQLPLTEELGTSELGVFGVRGDEVSATCAASTRIHEHALLRATGPCIHSGEFSLDEHDPGVSFFATPPRTTAPLWSLRLSPSVWPPVAGDAAMPGVRASPHSLEPQAFAPAAERAAQFALSVQTPHAKKSARSPAAALLRGIQGAPPRPSFSQLSRQPPDAILHPPVDFTPILSVGAVIERGGGAAEGGSVQGAAHAGDGATNDNSSAGAVTDAFDPRASFASGPRSARAALTDYAALLIRAREKRMTTMRRDFCRAEAARAAQGGAEEDDGAVPDWDKAVPRIVHAGALLLDAHVAKSLGALMH